MASGWLFHLLKNCQDSEDIEGSFGWPSVHPCTWELAQALSK